MSVRLLLVWVAIAFELVSPIPGPLALGAAWVLLVRPAWFRALVDEIYEDPSRPR